MSIYDVIERQKAEIERQAAQQQRRERLTLNTLRVVGGMLGISAMACSFVVSRYSWAFPVCLLCLFGMLGCLGQYLSLRNAQVARQAADDASYDPDDLRF